jgi:hypothetical protein
MISNTGMAVTSFKFRAGPGRRTVSRHVTVTAAAAAARPGPAPSGSAGGEARPVLATEPYP